MRTGGRYVELLGRYVGPHWRQTGVLSILLVTSIALQLVNPQLLRYFIDGAIRGAAVETLALAALAFMALALMTQLLTATAQYIGESLGWRATNALRADLALHCLRLDLGFHGARTPGELIERIDGDVTALAGFFSRFIVNVLGSLVLLVGILAVVIAEDVRAGAALSAFALLALFVMVGPLRTVAARSWASVRETSAQMYGSLGEHLSGTEDIRSNGSEQHALNTLALHHRAVLRARRAAMFNTSLIWSSTVLVFAVGSALAFGVGGYLWTLGGLTLGTVYLLFYYTELLRRPIDHLRRELEDLQRAVASVSRVDELLGTESRIAAGRGVPLPRGALAVELDRLTFRYEPEADPALRDVSLRLAPGRVLGVLGRTGSGKTTLARLLLRFQDPETGAVRLGGVDVRDAALDDVRARATLVTQDVQLFHGSVRDNLTFFDRSIDDERIADVLERVGLADRLVAWAGNTDVSEILDADLTARSFSAGEAQLLALARVFLREPGLVVLDEASSRLDPATEGLVERSIDALLAGRTGIVIAHRLATVHRCDEILILEGGQVVEQGQRVALADDPATRFARLLRTGLEPMLA